MVQPGNRLNSWVCCLGYFYSPLRSPTIAHLNLSDILRPLSSPISHAPILISSASSHSTACNQPRAQGWCPPLSTLASSGLGLAASIGDLEKITDNMLTAAAVACAESLTEEERQLGQVACHPSQCVGPVRPLYYTNVPHMGQSD